MRGRPFVADFDGTIARLPVDWDAVRAAAGVARIGDLWLTCGDWSPVTAAEIDAARRAEPVGAVCSRLLALDRFAVLTSNAEQAVHEFLERHPDLGRRCAAVVGRETLGGPKLHPAVFRRGLARALALAGGDGRPWYAGDDDTELALAAGLGAEVVDARRLEADDLQAACR